MKYKIRKITTLLIFFALIWESVPIINNTTQRNISDGENEKYPPILYGTTIFPQNADPHLSRDNKSLLVIELICEGLYTLDRTTNSTEIIPCLAAGNEEGVWSENGTQFTVNLRRNVYFHDGTSLTAYTVQNSFKRMMNSFSDENTRNPSLYQNFTPKATQNPTIPIVLNRTEVLSDYQIRFHLNYQYDSFKSLLCLSGTKIVDSSISNSTLSSIELNRLIGTGPYELKKIEPEKLEFKTFDNYHGELPEIRKLNWILIPDATNLKQGALSCDIDIIDEVIPDFQEDFEQSEYHSYTNGSPIVFCNWLSTTNQNLTGPIDFVHLSYDGPKKISFMMIHSFHDELEFMMVCIILLPIVGIMWVPLLIKKRNERNL
ncbi:ABC transporter substrate-binding protein [Candidatus Lokiarchaeum ossiferum]|uniref:ABC transporter substrate-binding protein n=1 Tax=Candidatus Lokiarchaeum ossiferum TaxID=2951803 RepID=UPI00352C900D